MTRPAACKRDDAEAPKFSGIRLPGAFRRREKSTRTYGDVVAGLSVRNMTGWIVVAIYLSLSSGASKRVLVPVALVENGLRWHVRAYDRQNGRFGDFVVSRITSVGPAHDAVTHQEQIGADIQWNRNPKPTARTSSGFAGWLSINVGILWSGCRLQLLHNSAFLSATTLVGQASVPCNRQILLRWTRRLPPGDTNALTQTCGGSSWKSTFSALISRNRSSSSTALISAAMLCIGRRSRGVHSSNPCAP
ncbi:WYL domain-containing protein [Paraburkholderia terrae]|uniref:WYL domain-containing protein n=1 Tax=Paraburkholderia terrae TaxID=311230 RepID=UPI003A5C4FD6